MYTKSLYFCLYHLIPKMVQTVCEIFIIALFENPGHAHGMRGIKRIKLQAQLGDIVSSVTEHHSKRLIILLLVDTVLPSICKNAQRL